MIREKQGSQGLFHVPSYIVGQHAKEHVGPDSFLQPMANGPHLQGKPLHHPKRLLHLGEVLVGPDHLFGLQRFI
jgi:hypothetical protein